MGHTSQNRLNRHRRQYPPNRSKTTCTILPSKTQTSIYTTDPLHLSNSLHRQQIRSRNLRRGTPLHNSRTPINPQLIPFAEPAWYTGLASPYYNASHHRLRKFMRNYMDENIIPHVFEWEEKKQQPKELFKQVADQGFIAAAMFPLPPKEYMQGVTLPAGIKVPPRSGGAVDNCSMRSGMGFMILCLMMSLVGLVPLAWEWFLLGVTPLPLRCAGVLTGSLSNWTSAYYSPWSRMDEKEGYT
jgi:hypothetical protein